MSSISFFILTEKETFDQSEVSSTNEEKEDKSETIPETKLVDEERDWQKFATIGTVVLASYIILVKTGIFG